MAFRAMAIVVMKRDSYYIIGRQGNAIVTWSKLANDRRHYS